MKNVKDITDPNECILCTTREQAKAICELMDKAGIKNLGEANWADQTYWVESTESICYYPADQSHSSLEYAERSKHPILPASDFLPEAAPSVDQPAPPTDKIGFTMDLYNTGNYRVETKEGLEITNLILKKGNLDKWIEGKLDDMVFSWNEDGSFGHSPEVEKYRLFLIPLSAGSQTTKEDQQPTYPFRAKVWDDGAEPGEKHDWEEDALVLQKLPGKVTRPYVVVFGLEMEAYHRGDAYEPTLWQHAEPLPAPAPLSWEEVAAQLHKALTDAQAKLEHGEYRYAPFMVNIEVALAAYRDLKNNKADSIHAPTGTTR